MPLKTLALLLSSPERKIEETMVRKIFTTFIQLMYKVFRDMEAVMFPTRRVETILAQSVQDDEKCSLYC